jgi:putative transposase
VIDCDIITLKELGEKISLNMSLQRKQPNNSEFTSELSLGGKKKEKSKRLKPLRDSEDITFNPIQLELNLFAQQLSTQELPVAHSSQILIDKLLPLPISIPTPKSFPKSEADLTSNGKSFFPYWKGSCKELSDSLLSHTKIDLPDLDLTCSNGFANNMDVKSWFSTKQAYLQKQKWLKTSSPSSTVLVADSMDCENTNLRSQKIQVYPDLNLKKEWNKWLAACRYCFNQAIAYQKKNGKTSKRELRNIIMNSDLPIWVKSTPCHIRQNAIFDAYGAYIASQDCKFRSCKAPRQTIKFNNSNYQSSSWYPKLTKGLTFIASEPIPKSSKNATQLIRTKTGWFAVFLVEKKVLPNNVQNKIIALDPGVRTFLTGFDGRKFVEFGQGDIGRITRLCQHLDLLMSRISKSTSSQQRQKMKKASARLRNKIKNLIDECHKQVSNWLVNNYQFILLPTFETSEMTNKKRRKIRSKTARQMLNWAHYRFKLHLKQKAELNGCNVVDVTEEFTSKTCTACGHIHQKLGGEKVFKCPECGHTLPRDRNGALGILLKALRDTSIVFLDDAIVVQCDDISLCTA